MKKDCNFCLFSSFLSLELVTGGKPATMLCEQPYREAHMSGNWNLWPTANQEPRPDSNEGMSLEVDSPAPRSLAMAAPWPTA